MSRFGIYIEDKVEEFRISGKNPEYIGLTEAALTKLSDEMRPKERVGSSNENAKVTEFIGLPVIKVEKAPEDGVYIHPRGRA